MTEAQKRSVVIIGVLDQEGSTNIPMALSIARYGLNIIPINYRTVINKYGYKFFETLVLKITESEKPDLVLICKGNGIQPTLIEQLNKVTRTWIYNMDPQSTIDRCPEVMENARIATFSSCTAMDMAEKWRGFGANCYHMIQGLDEQIFRPREPVKEYKADISLIGSRTQLRDEYKEYLENAGFKVRFYGFGYTDQPVLDVEFAKVCSSSKYMLSIDSNVGQHIHYFSNRLIRYLGCGACTFHLDPTNTLHQYFEPDKHLTYISNVQNLIEQINYLDQHKELAYELAMNGMDLVLRQYSWDRLILGLLQTALPEMFEVQNEGTVS